MIPLSGPLAQKNDKVNIKKLQFVKRRFKDSQVLSRSPAPAADGEGGTLGLFLKQNRPKRNTNEMKAASTIMSVVT